MSETDTKKFEIDGKNFTLVFQNDNNLNFEIVVYRADAIELFDVETVIETNGNYATPESVRAYVRKNCAYLWNN